VTPDPPPAPAPAPEVEELFDLPAQWRGAAILALGLAGEQRVAAASPGAGFPAALRSLEAGLALQPGDRVVDLGSGLGGVAEWLRVRTGAVVHAVEPAHGSRTVAALLFPELSHHASVAELDLAPRTVDAVVLAGVVSLVHDVDALLATAADVLRPGGRLGITDVCPLGEAEVTVAGPNVLRDVPVLARHLAAGGFSVTHVGQGPFAPSAEWQAVAQRVSERMAAEHADDDELRLVEADRAHLDRLREQHDLGSVTLVAVRAALDHVEQGRPPIR
jgi:phosphoethanolamine N-methyltransferase